MKTTSLLRLALAIILAGALTSAGAQASTGQSRAVRDVKGLLRLLPADAVTEHSIDIGKSKLAYTATAGTLAFYDQSGERSASVFYTAYVTKGAQPNRPLTFVFNGGPGAASRLLASGSGRSGASSGLGADAARAELRDNPDTWLAFTDLVLIDPIGTGWSRTAKVRTTPSNSGAYPQRRQRHGQGDRALRQ